MKMQWTLVHTFELPVDSNGYQLSRVDADPNYNTIKGELIKKYSGQMTELKGSVREKQEFMVLLPIEETTKSPFGNIKTPPDNIGGKSLKPGDQVYHWEHPEVIFTIIGEPKWGKDGGSLMILDDIAICENSGIRKHYSVFDLVKVEPQPDEFTRKELALARAESKFRRGMALHQEGCDRPCQYSPEQIGWDAAEAMKQVKVGFLNKAREEFGN